LAFNCDYAKNRDGQGSFGPSVIFTAFQERSDNDHPRLQIRRWWATDEREALACRDPARIAAMRGHWETETRPHQWGTWPAA
jgi:hypothetical protein